MSKEYLNEFVELLEDTLGHSFQGRAALEIAFTHRSYANESGDDVSDNERYEFLGDAVLQLIVSDKLMEMFPNVAEGVLSRFRSSIVKEPTLAKVAREMNLGRYLLLGKGEELTQGREKDSLLANVFEAIVAAIYISGGLEDARVFVLTHLGHALENVRGHSERHDYKTRLQEITQRNRKAMPTYKLVSEGGPDHEKVFESEVSILGRVLGTGRARSKKDSEQRAAREALNALEVEQGSSEES